MVDIPVVQALTGLLNNTANTMGGVGELGPDRWIFTSTLRQSKGRVGAVDFSVSDSMPFITMAVNPKSVQFSQPKRHVKVDTRDGSVFFHFTNRKGQNNDILTMSFSGYTGNIDLRGSLTDPLDKERDTGALNKLKVWHNLYQLTREPMVLTNNAVNEFSIFLKH